MSRKFKLLPFYTSFKRIQTLIRFRLISGTNLVLGKGALLDSPWRSAIKSDTSIGDYTRINGAIRIGGQCTVIIGKYAAFGSDVRIISSNHDMTKANLQIHFQKSHGFGDLWQGKGEIVIGHNAWIGHSVIILEGVKIGEGAVIGSGAVVTRDVPPFSIAVGVPANVIRKRFSDNIIDQLMDIQWWNWSEEKIERNKSFFTLDLTADPDLDLSAVIQ